MLNMKNTIPNCIDFTTLGDFFVSKKDLLNRFRSIVVGNKKTRYIYIDNNAPILLVSHIDTVQQPQLTGLTGCLGAGFDDRLGCYLSYQLAQHYPSYFDVLWCDYEESGRTTAEYFKPSHDYNWVVELDREGDDFVDYGLGDDKFCSLFTKQTGIKQSWGSFSDICSLDSVKASKINLGIGCFNSHSRNSGFNPHVCFTQIQELMEFVELYHDQHFPSGPGDYCYGNYNGYTNYTGYQYSNQVLIPDNCNPQEIDINTVYYPCEFCDQPTPEYYYDPENQILCCDSCRSYLIRSGELPEDIKRITDNENCIKFNLYDLWVNCADWPRFCRDMGMDSQVIRKGVGNIEMEVPIDILLDHDIVTWDELGTKYKLF